MRKRIIRNKNITQRPNQANKSRFKQGYYVPRNPEKYRGNPNKIIYRSSWELHFNQFLDNNPNILEWCSEEIFVMYTKPTDNKKHRYFPDYLIKYKDKTGKIRVEMIEVKPKVQTKKTRSRNPKTRLYEDVTYAINVSKWQAASIWCKQRGIDFRILTEDELFL